MTDSNTQIQGAKLGGDGIIGVFQQCATCYLHEQSLMSVLCRSICEALFILQSQAEACIKCYLDPHCLCNCSPGLLRARCCLHGNAGIQAAEGRILLLFFSFCAVNNTSVRHRPGRGRKQFSARGIDWDADGRVRKGQKNMCIFRSSLNYSCTHKPAWCFVFKNACSNSQCKVFFFFFFFNAISIYMYLFQCVYGYTPKYRNI